MQDIGVDEVMTNSLWRSNPKTRSIMQHKGWLETTSAVPRSSKRIESLGLSRSRTSSARHIRRSMES